MDDRESKGREARVIYTCWPYGPGGRTLCGLLLIVIGAALLADLVLPGWSEAVWGVALLALGVWVLSTRDSEGEPW